MTLLINLNKKISILSIESKSLSILFSQCKVSLCKRSTHDVSSFLANVGENCCSIPAQNLCHGLLTISEKTPTRTCTMQMSYSYGSDLPFKNFCKLAKRAETTRNYQKQVLVMIKHCLANSQINSMPE